MTLATIPIVVVPGIMGTRLRLASKDWDPDRTKYMGEQWAWPDSIEMRAHLDRREPANVLHDGTSHSAEERARGWAALPEEYYGHLLRELQSRYATFSSSVTCPVYAFGYDWRQDNQESATACVAFARRVLETEGAQSLIFVTHSMGGFVVRRALLDDQGLGHKTVCVMHAGQPVLGAPVAYRRHLHGVSRSFDGWKMRALLGGSPEDTLRLFSAMPSAMQLLPNDSRHIKLDRAYDRWLRLHRRDDRGLFEAPPQGPPVLHHVRPDARVRCQATEVPWGTRRSTRAWPPQRALDLLLVGEVSADRHRGHAPRSAAETEETLPPIEHATGPTYRPADADSP